MIFSQIPVTGNETGSELRHLQSAKVAQAGPLTLSSYLIKGLISATAAHFQRGNVANSVRKRTEGSDGEQVALGPSRSSRLRHIT